MHIFQAIRLILILKVFFIYFIQVALAQNLMSTKELRWIDLEWEIIEEANGYEVQIYTYDKEEIVAKKKTFESKWSTQLYPGKYKFKLRALDRRGVPGEWSEWTFIDVTLPNPVLISPYTDQTIQAIGLENEPVSFNWNEVIGAKKYFFEIWSDDKKFYHKEILDSLNLELELETARAYKWTVTSMIDDDEPKSHLSDGKPFFLKGGKIDHPKVKIENKNGFYISWDKTYLADQYEIYLFEKATNKKFKLIYQDSAYKKLIYTNSKPGTYRFAIRSIAKGRKSSSYAFIEYELSSNELDVRLNRVQIDVNVRSDNPLFYAYGLETMSFNYSGIIAENDTEVASTLSGYRIFLEGSYQDFYSYYRHRVGINTHLLKNIDKSVILSEIFYQIGRKLQFREIPYEFSTGVFVKEDLFVNGNRFENDVDYEPIITGGLISRIGSWYKLTRNWEIGAEIKLFIHTFALKTPSDKKINTTLSNNTKFFMNYQAKDNLSYSMFYGMYLNQIEFEALPGDPNDPNSTSVAPNGAINNANSSGSSFGFVVNSSF